MTDLSDFKDLYLQTAKENIVAITSGLTNLLQSENSTETIEQVHRNAHTLKSKSNMMGYPRIGEMAKAIEETLYEVKEGKTQVTNAMLVTLETIARQIEEEIQKI